MKNRQLFILMNAPIFVEFTNNVEKSGSFANDTADHGTRSCILDAIRKQQLDEKYNRYELNHMLNNFGETNSCHMLLSSKVSLDYC
ncbi:hypothetical protein D3C73_1018690 [compost metagenome]